MDIQGSCISGDIDRPVRQSVDKLCTAAHS